MPVTRINRYPVNPVEEKLESQFIATSDVLYAVCSMAVHGRSRDTFKWSTLALLVVEALPAFRRSRKCILRHIYQLSKLACPSVAIIVPTAGLMGVRIGTSFPSDGLSPSVYRDASHRLLRASYSVRRCMCRNPPSRRLCWYLVRWAVAEARRRLDLTSSQSWATREIEARVGLPRTA